MELKNSYRAQYKMRSTGKNGASTIITLPPVVVEREASKRGLTTAEFIEQFRVVAHFNNFDGVFYSFETPREKTSWQTESSVPGVPEEDEDEEKSDLRTTLDEMRRKIRGS